MSYTACEAKAGLVDTAEDVQCTGN